MKFKYLKFVFLVILYITSFATLCILFNRATPLLRDVVFFQNFIHFFSFVTLIHRGILPMGFLFILEFIFVGWENSSLKKLLQPSLSTQRDLMVFIMSNVGLWSTVVKVASMGLAWKVLADYGGLYKLDLMNLLPQNFFIRSIVYFLAFSFCDYWQHRLAHKNPVLWELHKLHHTATELTPLAGARGVPLEGKVFAIIHAAIGALIGVSPVEYAAVNFFIGLNVVINHSQLNTGYGLLGKWLISSPNFHRVHHARDPKYHDSNYGGITVIWDRLFGTYVKPQFIQALGTSNTLYNKPGLHNIFMDFVVHPYIGVFGALIGKRAQNFLNQKYKDFLEYARK